ncbi:hypothetical protein Acsp06_31340 [Actinomycetospora sp. NBRC 106375]|uniref:hypothetical protein n=1 Tax=Actinomycetospora sp. NBRC 106375 TaxID=3032207 RepID=UPI0024A26722|nr:hypothetical protein [Actinomycetospora sp. NBRC 106375]GLZ46949.1 hypothetical protein Acsp06_31340 [Actinomycetospora sp. NBRC 106375]
MTDTLALRWGPLRLEVEHAVYETVVLLTVLVVALDDGIADFGEAALVAVGPLVATFAAYVFAGVLARVSRTGAPPLARGEIRRIVGHSAQVLQLAVPPVVIAIVGAATDLYTPEEAVDAVIWLGLVFLVVIGGIGGYRARRTVLATVLGAVAAGVVGLFVLLLRLILEHG